MVSRGARLGGRPGTRAAGGAAAAPGGRTRRPPGQQRSARPAPAAAAAGPIRPAGPPVTCCAPSTERDAYANLLLPATLTERGLTGRDAALATELTYGTLRGQGTYDAVLAVCSDRELATLDPPCARSSGSAPISCWAPGSPRTPPWPPPSTWSGTWSARGRPDSSTPSCAASRPATWRPGWRSPRPARADDLEGHLAVRYSHPRWIVTALRDAAGSAARWPRPRPRWPPTASAPRLPCAPSPAWPGPPSWPRPGASPARWSEFGAYLAEGDPAGSRPWRRAGPASRTRPASSRPSR